MPILPRNAFIYCIVRLNRPDLPIPDMYFENTHIKTVLAAGGVPDDFLDPLPVI
jgi:hypothetical protein